MQPSSSPAAGGASASEALKVPQIQASDERPDVLARGLAMEVCGLIGGTTITGPMASMIVRYSAVELTGLDEAVA